jgi:hypothetical protein
MPRPLRRAYAGAIYQVLNRGDRREERQRFGWHPAALRQACKGGGAESPADRPDQNGNDPEP